MASSSYGLRSASRTKSKYAERKSANWGDWGKWDRVRDAKELGRSVGVAWGRESERDGVAKEIGLTFSAVARFSNCSVWPLASIRAAAREPSRCWTARCSRSSQPSSISPEFSREQREKCVCASSAPSRSN